VDYNCETSFEDKGGSNTLGCLKQAHVPCGAEQLAKET
jgi:hypothetical protein